MSSKDKAYHPLLFQGICHRGYWDEESTENGMSAFKKAIEAGAAFELDVHLSKDGELIVCHDSDLLRTTSKAGIIEELTLKQIKEGYRLHDGGEVPTLREVLDLTEERVPIVVELKVHDKNQKPLASTLLKELERIKDPTNITLISFYPQALYACRKAPYTRGLLIDVSHFYAHHLKRLFDYVDIHYQLTKKKAMKRYLAKGHHINVYTIETKEQLEAVKGGCDMLTFQKLKIEEVRQSIRE